MLFITSVLLSILMSMEHHQNTILYSCYHHQSKEGENFIPEHIFGYIFSGNLTVHHGQNNFTFTEGDFRFFQRNHLAKFTKHPPADGAFKSISVYLNQEMLRSISLEYDIKVEKKNVNDGVFLLPEKPLLRHYVNSLIPYLESLNSTPENILKLKVKEAVLLLLQEHPFLKDILFDFNEPGKVDLEAFMQSHYRYNISLDRFAYLTGRSLATFKRDFQKVLHTSPHRWLLQKRLEDAYYLIKNKGKSPSDVYIEVGFENLSHFSYAFKKAFGEGPSKI